VPGCWVLGARCSVPVCWVLGAGCWVLGACVLGAGCWVQGAGCLTGLRQTSGGGQNVLMASEFYDIKAWKRTALCETMAIKYTFTLLLVSHFCLFHTFACFTLSDFFNSQKMFFCKSVCASVAGYGYSGRDTSHLV
jgi:hypothetical protein